MESAHSYKTGEITFLIPSFLTLFPPFIYSSRTAVVNLWYKDPWGSVTPTQGVRDCLDYETNHFLVAPDDVYVLKLNNLQN
jgi:hypothetical protein